MLYISAVVHEYAELKESRAQCYRNALNTSKNRADYVAYRTGSDMAVIHKMPTAECGHSSSASFWCGIKVADEEFADSTLEKLYKADCLGKSNTRKS